MAPIQHLNTKADELDAALQAADDARAALQAARVETIQPLALAVREAEREARRKRLLFQKAWERVLTRSPELAPEPDE